MITSSISIISSPLQLLNAVEAVHHFKTNHNILVLIFNSELNSTDHAQKLNLLNEENWSEVIYYDMGKISKKKRFFEQVKLIKKLKQDSYDYLLAGDFGTIQQALMANLSIDNIYLLDDGTATIVTYEKLKNKDFFKNFTLSAKMKLLRYLLAGLQYKIKQDIDFFTIYNLQALPHLQVVQHDFSYLKQNRLKMCKNSKNIYILGQNLVEVGWISEENYLKYVQGIIKMIMEQYDGKIIYKPHRSEIITKAYDNLINERFSIDDDISQGPIEVSLIDNNIYPAIIISFFSSALFSLDKIFTDTIIYSIKIKKEDLSVNELTLRTIESLYATLEYTNIVFIDDFQNLN